MALSDLQLQLKRMIKQQILNGNTQVDFSELELFVDQLRFLPNVKVLTTVEVTQVIREITREEDVVLGGGATIRGAAFKPWLAERRPTVQLARWGAYEELLVERDWPRNVINDLSAQTDEIVELLGDPTLAAPWSRRGLLMGDVQSGKTATYLGALNKAIDYGYRLIVVIGGHTNDLRRQTQIRADSDLIGADTSYKDVGAQGIAMPPIGVALKEPSIRTNALTTVSGDFNQSRLQSGVQWLSDSNPTVLIVKKHAGLIANVSKYIADQAGGAQLNMPLVVIDDESDWGTPNTGSDTDPTRVNSAIRGLLAMSSRSSYLGITATPFANIFIDEGSHHDALGKDLFPEDYIRVMSTPSNYNGISTYFSEDHPALRFDVEDCVALLPIRHKKNHRITTLPHSLQDAIVSFYIGCAIRRLRGDGEPHPASMLINVSRFNDVQGDVEQHVSEFVVGINALISAQFAREDAPTSSIATVLHRVWAADFASTMTPGEEWLDLLPFFYPVASEISVQLVNANTAKLRQKNRKVQTPDERRIDELRPTIFIGGDVLARGLTLDGLQVSYFVREPRAMDTLMQTGRWFGYRRGYEDLVRIWMPEQTAELFSWSAQTTQELRELLSQMRALKLTPRDFGLRVRSHPDGFEVVASNKRSSTDTVMGEVLIHGRKFESVALSAAPEIRKRNFDALDTLVGTLTKQHGDESRSSANYRTWRGVDRVSIDEFFRKFQGAKQHPFFGVAAGDAVPQIAKYLDEAKNSDLWDVTLVDGHGADVRINGQLVGSSERNTITESEGTISLGNRRVATATNLVGALEPGHRNLLRTARAGQTVSENDVIRGVYDDGGKLLASGIERPMLLLFVVTTESPNPSKSEPGKSALTVDPTNPLAAAVLAFPPLPLEEEAELIRAGRGSKFIANSVWLRNFRGYLDDGDDNPSEEG